MPAEKTILIYQFSELDEKARERARNKVRETASDWEWWDSIYDDAKNVHLKITSFNLDRSRHAKGEFLQAAPDTADAIIKDHGETSDTYKLAKEFLGARDRIIDCAARDENGDFESELELDDALDELENEFKRALLEEYSVMLQNESEHMSTDEYIDDTIEANAYEFLETGDFA